MLGQEPLIDFFGATPVPGQCPERPRAPKPQPVAKVVRLQKALQALSKRVSDPAVSTRADGLIGPNTVKAANRALFMYAKGGVPSEFTSGSLTKAKVLAHAPQLASYIERAPFPSAVYVPPDRTPAPLRPETVPTVTATTAAFAPAAAPEGDPIMPPYYQQQSYYPPPGYGPPRGPGGLPTDRATVDVRAFIPAQYEHVQINPMMVMAVLAVGVVAYLAVNKKKG